MKISRTSKFDRERDLPPIGRPAGMRRVGIEGMERVYAMADELAPQHKFVLTFEDPKMLFRAHNSIRARAARIRAAWKSAIHRDAGKIVIYREEESE